MAINAALHNLPFVFSQKVLIAETRLNALSSFKHFKPSLHASFFSLARLKMALRCHNLSGTINTNLCCCCYPIPSEGWRHGGRSWSSRSQATPQRVDQRWQRVKESPNSKQHKESVAVQSRMRKEVFWDGCPHALHEGFSILPIPVR